ncbi:hypothetical protein VTJ49DRAFT_6756 [Mycothermus thermophilus]|uniref:U3 small nucleolar RNA-associated protein 14 n=1 Tax=Humicola insolens TaxID=85995 RepID=A0ABR3VID1_HUMIN
MPGRQAHGRPLLPGPANIANGKKPGKSQARTLKKSRAKATAKALDAFAIAAEEVPESTRGVRTRGLEDRPAKRPRRGDDEEDEDFDGFDDEDDAPRKKARRGDDDDFSDGGGGGDGESDSEEWHVGVGAEDEDSEIDSDEAFGESDEERFDGYAFSGSSSKKKKKPQKRRGDDDEEDEEEEEEEDEDDLESLGSDAIDLATALDQYEEDEEEGEDDSGSEEDDESAESEDESEDDEVDPSKLGELENMIAGFAGDEDKEEEEPTQTGKTKLSLKDLGLTGIKDEHIKKSLRLMSKEEKAVKPGSSKKLEVPLAKRQQDKLMRSAAYEKTTETLDRWIETVKHNRRADHLVFPLAQNAHDRGLSTGELMPITQKTSGTELEQTILSIMEESGLGPSATPQQKNDGEAAPKLTQAEIQEIARQRRRERELHSREVARAKRIKKIKSKTYRRIHRKEMKRVEEAELEAKLEAGELDSEEEREALDRRRALERVGTRLRENKWAKLGKKAGRAVWDENFRSSLTEAARRQEDLRRRIEGRANGSDDDDDDDDSASDASGDGDVRNRLRAELEKAAAYEEDDEPKSKLMQMKFMQRGEELRKKENEEAIAELRRQLDSDGEGLSEDDEKEIGRRQYGMGNSAATAKTPVQVSKPRSVEARPSVSSTATMAKSESTQSQPSVQTNGQSGGAWTSTEQESSAPGVAGVWTQVETSDKKNKKASKTRGAEIDISSATMVAAQPSKAKPKTKPQVTEGEAQDGAQDSDEEFVSHLPMAIRDQKLIERAFAGEDVHGQFEEEKAEVEREDDEKEIDNTLPGWGSWVGDGVSKREQRRHKGRFVTKVEGVKKTDRKDYKLKGVIVSEKRIRKNDKYLASQLPHPFESQHQYERSLRLPMGPEWSTKETFQDATKPRVIIKQGLIAPMSKPMY